MLALYMRTALQIPKVNSLYMFTSVCSTFWQCGQGKLCEAVSRCCSSASWVEYLLWHFTHLRCNARTKVVVFVRNKNDQPQQHTSHTRRAKTSWEKTAVWREDGQIFDICFYNLYEQQRRRRKQSKLNLIYRCYRYCVFRNVTQTGVNYAFLGDYF